MTKDRRVLKVMTVAGTRTQFIKAAAVSRAIVQHNNSTMLFEWRSSSSTPSSTTTRDVRGVPGRVFPGHHVLDLRVGSASHGEQTGETLKRLEPLMVELRPDVVMVYGDTNSALAGSLAGCEVAYRADIGRALRILQPALGTVISAHATAGERLILVGGNGIGGRPSADPGIVLDDDVTLDANASIIGPLTLGDNITVGAGGVVVSSHPGMCSLVGVPAVPVLRDDLLMVEPGEL